MKVDFEYGQIRIEKGILIQIYNSIAELDLKIARVCVNARLQISNGISYPCLFDVTRVKTSSREAREYLAKEDGAKYVTATALIVDSPVVRMVGNFFIMVNKPKVPIRLFTDRNSALNWLEKFKITNQSNGEKIKSQ